MEKKYESLSLFEFQSQFPDDDACYQYLASRKWSNGFKCEKCGHHHYCKGKQKYTRQCTKCRHQESPTSNTLFHKVKFPILKAFYIVYFISTNKKGISSTELSRKLSLRQKTCWSFKRKVMKAMESSGNYPLTGKVEVDEFVVGQQEEGTKGRQNKNKQLAVIAIERKDRGISRIYAKVIPNASSKSFRPFFERQISKDAHIKTDQWRGYSPLKDQYTHLEQAPSGKKGNNFPDMHRAIMMLKAWLRGTHHSVNDLQEYLNEYTYRFNRSNMKQGIFQNLIDRMLNAQPVFIKQLSID